MKTMNLTNNNKITRVRRLALTALLTLVPALLALGAVTVAPATASAASGSCSPALGASMEGWIFVPPSNGVPGGVNVVDVNGAVVAIGPFPSSVSAIDQGWATLDNPAPLEWFAKNIPGASSQIQTLFSGCQAYSSSLISEMNAEHFSPAQIGGVAPAGVTTAVTQTQTQTPTTTQTTTKTSTTTKTPPTQPSSTSTSSTTTPAPQYPPVVTSSTATGGGSVASHVKQIQAILARDQQVIVADHHNHGKGKTSKVSLLPYMIGGLAILAVVVVVILVRQRKPKTVDEINRQLGGKRL